MPGRGIYLVGSVPMSNEEEVFRRVGGTLGDKLRWLPDGETGPRRDWIAHLEKVFSSNPALTPADEIFRLHPEAPPRQRYKLSPGRTVSDIQFPNLGYADDALRSYATFARLKAEGVLPPTLKFQVDLVPAHSVLWLFLVDELHMTVDPIYNRAVVRELGRILDAIPHQELAIQFDVASAVFARLERGASTPYGENKQDMQANFSRIMLDLANRVPADVDLLFHFCYGDSNHKHVVEPTDVSDMVEFANRLIVGLKRPPTLIHMPVPRNRKDEAYFAPLRSLKLPPDTSLALGLVHHTDGVEGSRERLSIARKFADRFLVATECGFGRRAPETIQRLLEIHRDVAESDG